MSIKNEKKRLLVPRLRFPEFHTGWATPHLHEIVDIITERAGNKKCVLMSINQGVGLVSQMEKFGREIAGQQYKNYFVLSENDFAYNKSATKEYPQGFIAVYSGKELAAVPNSIFTCFKPQMDKIFPQFLEYQFFCNLHGKWLKKYITVGARAHGSLNVDNDDLLALPVPIPEGESSLQEQQKIADCLATLDECITAETDKLDALKAHKKGLLRQLFPAEGETVPQLRFPEFLGAGKWEESPLSELLLAQPDYGLNAPSVPYSLALPTYIRITDISDDGFFIADKKVSVDILATDQNYLSDGEIVLARTGASVGKAYMYKIDDGKLVFAGFLIRIKPDNQKVNSKFLFYFLFTKRYLKWIEITSPRSGQPGINSDEYATLPTPLPPCHRNDGQLEQQKIADCLSSLDELIAAQSQKIDLLKTHKKGLIQQLFPAIDEAQV